MQTVTAEASRRSLNPLWQTDTTLPQSVRDLTLERCAIQTARDLNALWHSRLPRTQAGPWQYAFAAHSGGIAYAVALWHNPSARGLPAHWLELRRMAISDDAPRYTASWMLSQMRRWFRQHCPERERMISYQDSAVHQGTIYKAAGWQATHIAKPRGRDRSKARVGTRRDYRSNLNGLEPDGAPKVRWEMPL